MKYVRALSATALLLLASCTNTAKPASTSRLPPLAEPISKTSQSTGASAQAAQGKCKCTQQETSFSKISKALKTSDIVLIAEYHFWVAHYTVITSNMEKLHELGIRKVFLELKDGVGNTILAEYQRLRRRLFTEISMPQKEKDEILGRLETLSNSFTNSLLSSYDPAKPWYLMALIERAAFMGVEVICIDMLDSEIAKQAGLSGLDAEAFAKSPEGIALRNAHMAERILAVLGPDEKALVLVGNEHANGLVQLLGMSRKTGFVLGYEE